MHRLILLLLYCCLLSTDGQAQLSPADTVRVSGCVEANGDTIPCGWLPEAVFYSHLTKEQKRIREEWSRLRNAVYVTYPYAVRAARIMNEINAKLVGVTDKKQRKAIIKAREKELKEQFSDKIKNLSVYQGKVLMKLIYRQTGNNCYEIIQEYKGNMTAAFYQTVAFVFGSSLKQSYDPAGDDRAMERIVQDVERMYGYRS
jgi:hypothetical protein